MHPHFLTHLLPWISGVREQRGSHGIHIEGEGRSSTRPHEGTSVIFTTPRGDGVYAQRCPQRAPQQSDEQARRRRNALWLAAVTVGILDPATRRSRRHTAAELAAMWGVTHKAVRQGIRSARLLERQMEAALADGIPD